MGKAFNWSLVGHYDIWLHFWALVEDQEKSSYMAWTQDHKSIDRVVVQQCFPLLQCLQLLTLLVIRTMLKKCRRWS
jgi:hypothetical protein